MNVKAPLSGRSGEDFLLGDLVTLSRRFGADPEFTRGGGGNSSVKSGGVMHIKPSGTSLATLTTDSFIGLRIEPLLDFLDAPSGPAAGGGTDEVFGLAAAARVGIDDGRRPSVELLFHALLPERFVLHTHPTTINSFTCSTGGREATERLFGEDVLWVPYIDPGVPLAREIRDLRRAFERRTGKPAPRAILMQNHGLLVSGDTIAEVEAISVGLLMKMQAHLASLPAADWGAASRLDTAAARLVRNAAAPALRGLLAGGARLRIVTFDDSQLALAAAATPLGLGFAEGGPLTPDQIVYAGSFPLVVELPGDAAPGRQVELLGNALARRRESGQVDPIVVVIRGLGVFTAGDSYAQADTARDVFLDSIRVSADAHRLGGVRPLSEKERLFIEHWEAEAYRKRVAAGAGSGGRARGLVAVVTGAAQGFGRSIAADLVAQGAHVVLADINAEQAERGAADLVAAHGSGRAVAIRADVGDDASTAACFDEVVRRFGGLDLLVSNAGILRAGSVMTQPVEEFDAVTRINYRGYFLCVRHAAPIMARQHATQPEYMGDIVEINSKSGLEGSSRNFAYAGSKFGGVGLTQSFALELIGDGIKVNAICPGNFLDGPLWSDPQNGLFVQYLREGKVAGARTVEEVRRYYESRVPMGRGCTPEDVLEALYYVVAQRYETGQAIPVTGGQVMLR